MYLLVQIFHTHVLIDGDVTTQINAKSVSARLYRSYSFVTNHIVRTPREQ